MPKRGWTVYVFPADFNSIMPEAKSELTNSGFKESKRLSADPNEVRSFSKTYADGSLHEVTIYNKRLGSVAEAPTVGEWISISSYDDHHVRRRIQTFVRRIKRLTLRKRDTRQVRQKIGLKSDCLKIAPRPRR